MAKLYQDCCIKSLSAYNILYRFCEKHDITYFFETDENAKHPAPATALYDYYSDLYNALNKPFSFDILNGLVSHKIEMSSIKWSELGVDDSVKKQYTKLKADVTEPLKNYKNISLLQINSMSILLFLRGYLLFARKKWAVRSIQPGL